MPTPPPCFMGIDVAKAEFVWAQRLADTSATAPNAEAGIRRLVDELQGLRPTLIVLDATGGDETALVAALAAAGLPVVVANPRQGRDFARATGHLAKTDSLDAHILALCAERVRPAPRPLREADTPLLAGLLIDQAVRESPAWRATEDRLRRVPGIGRVVSRTLVATLPELGHLTHKPMAALVGVAPLARDRGTLRGRRLVWGGRAPVRAALDLAALVASRRNPVIRACYTRLVAAGTPKKAALTACRHTRLTMHPDTLGRDHRAGGLTRETVANAMRLTRGR